MTKTKKIISAATAAALLGGGAIVYTTLTSDAEITLDIPTIEVPSIDLPTLGVANLTEDLNIPTITTGLSDTVLLTENIGESVNVSSTLTTETADANLQTFTISNSTLTTETVDANLQTSNIDNDYKLSTPTISCSLDTDTLNTIINIAQLNNYSTNIEVVSSNLLNLSTSLNIDSAQLLNILIAMNLVDSIYTDTVQSNMSATYKEMDEKRIILSWIEKTIKDKRIRQSEQWKNLAVNNFIQWKKIFDSNPQAVQKSNYKITKNDRFIFQVWTPETEQQQNNLMQQLDFIKSKGYNGVVVCWNGTSPYASLVEIQKKIIEKGFKIWLAFSPLKQDSATVTTFVQPKYYAQGLQALAQQSQAFLMCWRRTSIHMNIQNKQWQNYTMQALRKGNKNIGFIGQVYWGQIGNSNKYRYYINYRDNYNAVMAVNFGFVGVNQNKALILLKSMQNDPKQCQYVGLVQGMTAKYFSTSDKTRKRTKAQYRKINQKLQERFLNAGFDAVASMAGQGTNTKGYQDDMCLSKNRIEDNNKY